MNHIGLFEGIGGFSLAARWAGWETIAWCEWNEFGQKVLKYHFPKAEPHGDIKSTDFTIYRGKCQILTGGFPCQPYSNAGKRLGKEDDRHLWPEMLRAIREIQPKWVVGENVLGLVNWNGGLVFDEVQADLENQGYEVQPYVLPACAVNAPHRRDRVWFIAYRERLRLEHSEETRNIQDSARKTQSERREFTNSTKTIGTKWDVANAEIQRKQREPTGENKGIEYSRIAWQRFPSQPPICGGNDGIPRTMDGITFSKWRTESVKAYGNAVVPNVVYQIFKAIEAHENLQE